MYLQVIACQAINRECQPQDSLNSSSNRTECLLHTQVEDSSLQTNKASLKTIKVLGIQQDKGQVIHCSTTMCTFIPSWNCVSKGSLQSVALNLRPNGGLVVTNRVITLSGHVQKGWKYYFGFG